VWIQQVAEERITGPIAAEISAAAATITTDAIRWPLSDLEDLARDGFAPDGTEDDSTQERKML
jgi:hypothetical protein